MTKLQEEAHREYNKNYAFYRVTYSIMIGGRRAAVCNIIVRSNVPIPILKEIICNFCRDYQGTPDMDTLAVTSYIFTPDKKDEKRAIFLNDQERIAYFKKNKL